MSADLVVFQSSFFLCSYRPEVVLDSAVVLWDIKRESGGTTHNPARIRSTRLCNIHAGKAFYTENAYLYLHSDLEKNIDIFQNHIWCMRLYISVRSTINTFGLRSVNRWRHHYEVVKCHGFLWISFYFSSFPFGLLQPTNCTFGLVRFPC